MAELQPLAEELTCSICLELFQQPITTPCGHNFCSPCLDESWTGQGPQVFCPQCRACFLERPQLQKNTVLCAVVERLRQARSRWDVGPPCIESQDGEPLDLPSKKGGQGKEEGAGSVYCDHCLQALAVKTCFTCMASFCQEHLRPHLESPAFRGHELQPPVWDLARRKCPEHSRLREFFCPQHGTCICCVCVVGHKNCCPVSLNVAMAELKFKMNQKLTTIYEHINKTSSALKDVKLRQHDVQEIADKKRNLLKRKYEEIKFLIESEEMSSLRKLKEEERRVLDKYDHIHQVLLKKKSKIESVKEEIELLLTRNDEIAFLERASKLQEPLISPVCVPKYELNQVMIYNIYQNASSLKEALKHDITYLQERKSERATSSVISGNSRLLSSINPSKLELPFTFSSLEPCLSSASVFSRGRMKERQPDPLSSAASLVLGRKIDGEEPRSQQVFSFGGSEHTQDESTAKRPFNFNLAKPVEHQIKQSTKLTSVFETQFSSASDDGAAKTFFTFLSSSNCSSSDVMSPTTSAAAGGILEGFTSTSSLPVGVFSFGQASNPGTSSALDNPTKSNASQCFVFSPKSKPPITPNIGIDFFSPGSDDNNTAISNFSFGATPPPDSARPSSFVFDAGFSAPSASPPFRTSKIPAFRKSRGARQPRSSAFRFLPSSTLPSSGSESPTPDLGPVASTSQAPVFDQQPARQSGSASGASPASSPGFTFGNSTPGNAATPSTSAEPLDSEGFHDL